METDKDIKDKKDKEDKEDKEDKKPSLGIFLEKIGGGVIAVCIICLLISLCISYYRYSSNNNLQDVSIQITLSVDSTGVLAEESMQHVDSLKEELIRHEQLLENRYKHVLEQKENMNDLLTIGGMFLTTILALFGFFGYKSITTLEEKVKEDALLAVEKTAEKTAEETSKSKFDNFEQSTTESLSIKIQKDVKDNVNKAVGDAEKKILKASAKEMQNEYGTKIEDIYDTIKGIKTSLESLHVSLSKLEDRVENLETSRNLLLPGGRRSLENGGEEQ